MFSQKICVFFLYCLALAASDCAMIGGGSGRFINLGKTIFPPLQHIPGISPLSFITLQNRHVTDMDFTRTVLMDVGEGRQHFSLSYQQSIREECATYVL
ncbi:hypothetical protein NPIL_286491 [Nephila pilipes]|uniref:Uncharacterized protein n=1 Tax=Nephila pilipes TaxID=299642 RepID=A0A8X6P8H7_NEPPI|nr:hypothetical protein NPIL_286491 [Nephila pilipes]